MSILNPLSNPATHAAGVLGLSIVLCAGSFGLGWAIKARLADAQIASLQAGYAQERAAAARAAADAAAQRLQAQAAADQAAASTVQSRAAQAQITTAEVKHALQNLPDTGRGLTGATRGLLNRAIASAAGTGIAMPTAQPAAARPAAATAATSSATGSADHGGAVSYAISDAAAPSDQPATERDTAEWIAGALESYETCRARIDALRAWDQTAFGATNAGASGDKHGR